jgi:hypothetical protein
MGEAKRRGESDPSWGKTIENLSTASHDDLTETLESTSISYELMTRWSAKLSEKPTIASTARQIAYDEARYGVDACEQCGRYGCGERCLKDHIWSAKNIVL